MKTQLIAITTVALLAGAAPENPIPAFSAANNSLSVATVNTDFAHFRVHRQGKRGVTAVWSVTNPADVTGFTLQRTYQDPTDPFITWDELGPVAVDPSNSYKYTDEDVLAGVINYRIVAHLSGGGSVISAVETVRIMSH